MEREFGGDNVVGILEMEKTIQRSENFMWRKKWFPLI